MKMKRKSARRIPALLLTLVMLLSLMPTALAAATSCPKCQATGIDVAETATRTATCYQKGEIKLHCNKCSFEWIEPTDINPSNHEYKFQDNGDGTHSGECPYHYNARIDKQAHQIVNGRCTVCLAVDYSKVTISLPENPAVYVPLGSTDFGLTLGDVAMSIGSADITGDYNLTYSWYHQGTLVYTGDSYVLPASVTEKEGDLSYVCFVMAVPKSGLTTQPISASCTVTVHVRNLITAHATVGLDDTYLALGDMDRWSTQSVEEQIYKAAYDAGRGTPQYVVFGTKPVSKVGALEVESGSRYYFDRSTYDLSNVRFRPSKEATGPYAINFTVYNDANESFYGVLTVTVQQYAGNLDVLYTTSKDMPVTLDGDDFADFWNKSYPRGALIRVTFTELPSTYEGGLYTGYASNARPGTRIKSRDTFYMDPGNSQYGIDDLTFVPGVRQGEYVAVPFEAFGTNDRDRQTYLDGVMYVFVSSGEAEDITWKVSPGGSYNFNEEDLLRVYQKATGNAGSNFYIQLLDVPASGTLYAGYSNGRGVKLTEASIAARPFYYSGSRGELISSLTYVSNGAISDAVRYVAYDLQGKILYVANLRFTAQDLSVSYTCTTGSVSFKGSDFEALAGVSGKLTNVSFTPPDASLGTLYYGRSATAVGTAITSDSVWYSVSATSTTVNALRMDNVSFVPKAGYSGTVSIPFAAYDAAGSKVSGTVKIAVTAAPVTPVTPPTTPTIPIDPSISFKDVANTDANKWYYSELMQLASAGVIGGYEDGTFRPNGSVTYGEALKMIMMAAGYPAQTPTDKHWASGFLAKAQADGILAAGTVDLDRIISRYAIADIAYRALKLPASTRTASPFSDMAMTAASAGSVLALYDAGIIQGTTIATGEVKYYGVNSITRSQLCMIIYRMNAYRAART